MLIWRLLTVRVVFYSCIMQITIQYRPLVKRAFGFFTYLCHYGACYRRDRKKLCKTIRKDLSCHAKFINWMMSFGLIFDDGKHFKESKVTWATVVRFSLCNYFSFFPDIVMHLYRVWKMFQFLDFYTI